VKANLTATVSDQPPAGQLITKNTFKHNAHVVTGWGTMMQGQTKKYSFCFALFGFGQKKKEDFLRLAKRILVSFGNQTVSLLFCLGVFASLRNSLFSFAVNMIAGHTTKMGWQIAR
jgi:hypothetical protein